MNAGSPTVDDVAAIRALVRGAASPGQQRRGMAYIMGQLCGVARVSFAGEGGHTTAFRLGAQAVGVAIAQIGDAVVLSFPIDEESTDANEELGGLTEPGG